MRKITLSFIGLFVFISSLSSKADWLTETEINANVGFVSNYLFYGASQTASNGTSDGGAAFQGGIDITFPFKILGGNPYFGVFGSNVEWGEDNSSSLELDFFGGIAGDSIGFADISWDLGLIHYYYPDQDEDRGLESDFDYTEYYVNFGYALDEIPFSPSLSVGIYYSNDFFGTNSDSIHVPVKTSITLPFGFGAYLNYGYFNLYDNDSGDYSYYAAGINKSILGIELDVSWTDVTDNKNCRIVQGTNCGGMVFSVGKSF